MSRWFRHYAGMMRDDKLVRVAIRSKQTIERVVWVYAAILESAAEIDDEGRFDFDNEEAAYFLRADAGDIKAIQEALEGAGRISADRVVKWGHRQFSSDKSADRQRKYRDRKRAEVTEDNGDAEVTSPLRHRDAPETETELDTEETPIAPLGGSGSKSEAKASSCRAKIVQREKLEAVGSCLKRVYNTKHLIPADWIAPLIAELPPRSRACAEQWTEASYLTEAEGFALYWSGERKMKSDWTGTWANRVIARHSAVMRDQKFGNAAPSGKKELTAQELRDRAEWFVRHGQQDRAEECRRKAVKIEQGIAA